MGGGSKRETEFTAVVELHIVIVAGTSDYESKQPDWLASSGV